MLRTKFLENDKKWINIVHFDGQTSFIVNPMYMTRFDAYRDESNLSQIWDKVGWCKVPLCQLSHNW